MADTTLRQLKLLEFIPRQPLKKSPQKLQDDLSQIGFEVSIRTIQRDLKVLSSILPLISDERDKPYGWSWHREAVGLSPAMDPIEALTLSLAKQYLKPLMPMKNYRRLEIFFDRADKILDEMPKSKINNWRNSVRVVSPAQELLSPSLNEEVEEKIYDAILHEKQVEALYKNRGHSAPKKRVINPFGLILQGSIHRIICTTEDDDQLIRNLPLHRFMEVRENGKPSLKPKDFDIEEFIESENLSFLISKSPINLKLKFYSFAGFHLQERPLAQNQKIIDLGNGQLILEAEVRDTSQLRWWLLGFGADVEIIKPKFLRQEFKTTANSLKELYLDN